MFRMPVAEGEGCLLGAGYGAGALDGHQFAAAATYDQLGEKPGREELLYLLEAGMALHAAKDYAASQERFMAADAIIEELNFKNSAGEVIKSIISDDRSRKYHGEEFEAVLVNSFGALNFLMAGGPDAAEKALVECRRVDWKLNRFNELRGRKYLQNAFARYVSGICYETDGELNDAYIDYKLVHKLRPEFRQVRKDLIRLSAQLGFRDELAEWEREFGIKHDPGKLKGTGEVVLVMECGRAPEKIQREEVLDLPAYHLFNFNERGGVLMSGGRRLAVTELLEDVEATAVSTLEDRMGKIIAGRVAKGLIKAGAALGTRKLVRDATRDKMDGEESSGVADLAGLAVFAILSSFDKADTRCWMTLPANLQVARARLPAGTHTLELHTVARGGGAAGHVIAFENVQVRAGGITLLVTRTMH